MRFQDMPYSRIDFEKEEENLKKITEEFRQAGTWEEELEAHKKYYILSDHVKTMRVLAEIRHSIDTADAFYSAEKDYYDEKMRSFPTGRWSIRIFFSSLPIGKSWSL